MAIYTLMSASGSPGVTTTALAVTYAWSGRALLAECAPAGGNVLAGFLGGQTDGIPGGLLDLALGIAHSSNPAVLWEHVVSLDQEAREWLLLPGLKDPRHAPQVDWDAVVDVLRSATTDTIDVVADVGALGRPDTPLRLIAASDVAVLVIRPTLRQINDARPRLEALGRVVGTAVPVALCLIGSGDYSLRQVSQALYGLPVIGMLPWSRRCAEVLSDGRRTRRSVRISSLIRDASALGAAMRDLAERNRPDEQLAAESAMAARRPSGG
ncbi:ParA family protein [Nonomuraea sp. NN258]|uniref:ParA family protein n=1 Tax=Nonomuraea antri TaxID=2730852 RepID=UPI0015680F26|nr:ParA family protein [Nonomuraea antri]NRQ32095.1 ParA family protein [Nonomuraea antri]